MKLILLWSFLIPPSVRGGQKVHMGKAVAGAQRVRCPSDHPITVTRTSRRKWRRFDRAGGQQLFCE
jgi:hypothetical protein